MRIEDMIESLIRQGVVSREEVDAKIAEYKKNSPVNDLHNIAFVEALQMEMIEQQASIIAMLMQKISVLEEKLNA